MAAGITGCKFSYSAIKIRLQNFFPFLHFPSYHTHFSDGSFLIDMK